MSQSSPAAGPSSLPELLVYALRIEEDAAERYRALGDQMEVHNNLELAALFHRLAGYEAKHADEIRARMTEAETPSLKPWEFRWDAPESPEALDFTAMHYRMTPHQALQLALAAETAAYAFFHRIEESTTDPQVRKWSAEFAEEEQEHMALIERELTKYPPAQTDWADDPDPPQNQE